MRDLLITLIVFGAVPFILMRPFIGVYVWSWLSYMNPHRFSWGFAYDMPFAAVTAGALLIGLLTTKEKNKFPLNRVTVFWLLFIFWVILSTLFAISFETSVVELKRVIKIQLITLVTLLLITSKKKLDYLIWAIVISLGFFGVKGGVFTVATAGSYRVWGPPDSFIEGNNELALALLMILPLMWYLRSQATNLWVKRVLLISVALTMLSIISSYSRGAFLAAAAVMIMFWLKSSKKLLIGIALVIVAVGTLAFMPAKYIDRMSTIQTYEEDTSAMGRINAWQFAFNLAKDRPLTGGGFGTFTKSLFMTYAPNPLDHHDAHSIYFEVLGEQGFVGLFLFLGMWFFVFRLCSNIIAQTKGDEKYGWANVLARMVQVSIVAYAVGGAFLGLAYFDLPYHLMCIAVLCHSFISKESGTYVRREMTNPVGRML
ncbi:putative O-glycosylation ligase, exosortase A system-associated [Pseudomonadota bacterium]